MYKDKKSTKNSLHYTKFIEQLSFKNKPKNGPPYMGQPIHP